MGEVPGRGLKRSSSARSAASAASVTSMASNATLSARTTASGRLDAREVRRVLDRLKAELDRERLARRHLMKDKAEEMKRLRTDFEEELATALRTQAEELKRTSMERSASDIESSALHSQLFLAQKELLALRAELEHLRRENSELSAAKEAEEKKETRPVLDPHLARTIEVLYKDIDRKLRRLRGTFAENRSGVGKGAKDDPQAKKAILENMADLRDNLRYLSAQLGGRKSAGSEEKIRSLESAVKKLRQENNELRTSEQPISRLRRRNAELAEAAQKLEARARSLEHAQRYPAAAQAAQAIVDADALRREFELKRAQDLADHAHALQSRDRELSKMRAHHKDLKSRSDRFNDERGDMERMLKAAQRERLLLERQLAWNKDLLKEPANRTERLKELQERLSESETERARLRTELAELQRRARGLQYKDSTVLTSTSPEGEQEGAGDNNAETPQPGVGGSSRKASEVRAEHSGSVCDPLALDEAEHNDVSRRAAKMEDLLKHLQEAAEERRSLEQQQVELRLQLEKKEKDAWFRSERQDKSGQFDPEDNIESMRAKLRELERRCELQALKHEEVLLELEAVGRKQKYRPASSAGSTGDFEELLSNGFKGDRFGVGNRPLFVDSLLSNFSLSSSTALPYGLIPGRPGPGGMILPSVTSVTNAITAPAAGPRPIAALAASRFQQQQQQQQQPAAPNLRVFVAKYNYDPHQCSPNENPDLELALQAGDYVIVHGDADEDGFLTGETIDGKRGLVPSNFVEPVNINEVGSDFPLTAIMGRPDGASTGSDDERLAAAAAGSGATSGTGGPSANGVAVPEVSETVDDAVAENAFRAELPALAAIPNPFPAPRRLQVDRQLSQSVLISWAPPDQAPPDLQAFHIYVDGQFRSAVKVTEKTRALVESLDSSRPHRLAVRAIYTQGQSKDAECTLCVSSARQANNLFTPTHLKASRISARSAKLSWLPGNSALFHSVHVNGREVRLCPPGQYKVPLTGLEPDSHQRVLVKARRPASMARPIRPPGEDAGAFVEFRTLPGGGGTSIPAPTDVQVEAGPQDGTLLVTWSPVRPEPQLRMLGYAVCINGRCVEEVADSAADHCLLSVSAVMPHLSPGSPEAVLSVRTIAGDGSQSVDCEPLLVLSPGLLRQGPEEVGEEFGSEPELSDIQEEEEDLIERERQVGKSPTEDYVHEYPPLHPKVISVPQIHITKDRSFSEEDLGHSRRYGHSRSLRESPVGYGEFIDDYRDRPPASQPRRNSRSRGYPRHASPSRSQRPPPPTPNHSGPPPPALSSRSRGASMEEDVRVFVALFDYDPATMSPNPDAVQEELPFREGQLIRVYGERDDDGFYQGECDGRRGLVPCNMVGEVEMQQEQQQQQRYRAESPRHPRRSSLQPRADVPPRSQPSGMSQQALPQPRQTPSPQVPSRRSDGAAGHVPRRMVAIYDYDPQSLSPNVDGEDVELSFRCGDLIYVYGEMDEDGFYTGELGQTGQRGLVPSNFLREVTPDDEKPGPAASAGLALTPQGHGPSPLTVPNASPRPNRRQHSIDLPPSSSSGGGASSHHPPLVQQHSTTSQHRSSPKSSSSGPKNSTAGPPQRLSDGTRPNRVSGGSMDSGTSSIPSAAAAGGHEATDSSRRYAGGGGGGGGSGGGHSNAAAPNAGVPSAGESPPPPLNLDEMPIVLDLTPTPSGVKAQKPRKKQSVGARDGASDPRNSLQPGSSAQPGLPGSERKKSVIKNPFKKTKH